MWVALAWEWGIEYEGDRDIAGNICMAEDDASDDLIDEESTEDATEDDGLAESNGVDSEAGGPLVLVLASRLQTGQKVLHEVSQESTQKAWNSVKIRGKLQQEMHIIKKLLNKIYSWREKLFNVKHIVYK